MSKKLTITLLLLSLILILFSDPINADSCNTVTFTYNASDLYLYHCDLIINDVIVQTEYNVPNGINTFTSFLPDGEYTWSVNCTDTVDQTNSTETWELTVACQIPEPTDGGGAFIKQIIYGLTIDLYGLEQNKELLFRILIQNNGDTVGNNLTLAYHIKSPDGKNFSEAEEIIFGIPPTTYNETDCQEYNGTIKDGRCTTILERKIDLPFNADLGKWRLNVEYFTPTQKTRSIYQFFDLVPPEEDKTPEKDFEIKEKTAFDKFIEGYWVILLIIFIIFILVVIAVALNKGDDSNV